MGKEGQWTGIEKLKFRLMKHHPVSCFINKLIFIDLLYCFRNAGHTKNVCAKYTIKAKCPFLSASTLSPTFAGLYSRFQFAFETLLRMFVCKFGMFVAKFQCLF